jgi:hypothetical protein
MLFENINTMKANGFTGFKTIDYLNHNYNIIPESMGVYFVINHNLEPLFLMQSIGGHFKGKNPTVDIPVLKNNWIESPSVIYIGKAGGLNSNANLKKRLKQYLRFGQGYPVGHWGGRFIWQLSNSKKLIIAWKELHEIDPRIEEKKLLTQFEKKYNKLPFANLVR